MRDKADNEQNNHVNEMLDKDDKIIRLTRELRDYERKI